MSKWRKIFEPEILELLLKNGLNPEYPEGKRIRSMSYDIDFVYTGMINTAARTVKALKKGMFAEISMLQFSRINKTWIHLWSFRRILELEEKYGAKSHSFLVLDQGNEDFTFSIEQFEGEFSRILDEGWEVGLHGGHEAYDN